MQADCCNSGDFYNPFPNYAFTGSVRPMYPLSDRRKVPDHIPRPDYAEDGKYIIAIGTAVWLEVALGRSVSEAKHAGQPPRILSKEEQERMRTVCRVCVLAL